MKIVHTGGAVGVDEGSGVDEVAVGSGVLVGEGVLVAVLDAVNFASTASNGPPA